MTSIVDALGSLALVVIVVWTIGGLLLRLAATSCFVCAAGLLALGDIAAALGVAGCGLACWIPGQLLYRARRGCWRSARAAARLSQQRGGRGRGGATRRPA